MNSSAMVFFGGAPVMFGLGYVLGGMNERKKAMNGESRKKGPFGRSIDWLAEGNRIVGLVVVALLIGIMSGVLTYTNGQTGRSRDDRNLQCLNAYVTEIGATQAPRALANKAMNDARRDWDRGYSTDKGATKLNKAELKQRYLTLYEAYDEVTAANPPVPTLLKFCHDYHGETGQ